MAAIVLLVYVVNVAALPGPQSQQPKPNLTPWDGNGNSLWNNGNPTNLGVEYEIEPGTIKKDPKTNIQSAATPFKFTWGEAHQNQIWSYERTDIDAGWRYEGGAFEFTSDYVWTDFGTRLDERAGSPGTIVEFGYYKIDADGQISDHIATYKKATDISAEMENTVVFKKGEKIGVYMTIKESNGTNVTFTSIENAIEGAAKVAPNVDTNSRGDETQYFCLFDDRPNQGGIGNYSHYEYYLAGYKAFNDEQSYEEFIDNMIEQGNTNITDSDGNPIGGQPLPGLLLTMAIGGTAVAGIAKKRKKA